MRKFTHLLNLKKEIDQWGPIDGKLLYASFWYTPISRLSGKKWGVPWPTTIGTLNHDKITYYFEKNQIQTQGELAIKKYIGDKQQRKILWLEYKRQLKILKNIFGIFDAPTTTFLQDEMRKHIKRCYFILMRFWGLVLTPEIANFAASEYLKKKILPFIPKEKISDALQILLAPEKMSFHAKSDYELYNAVCTAKNIYSLKKKLFQYARKWHWLDNSYLEVKNLSSDDFYKRIKNVTKIQAKKKLNEIIRYYKEVRHKKKKLQARYKIPKRIMDLANTLSFSIWWQDHRKGVIWWVNSIIEKMTRFAEKEFHVPFNDLMYFTAEEWVELLQKNKKISKIIIQKRKEFSVHIFYKNKGYEIVYGSIARRIARGLRQSNKIVFDGILYGTPVSRGHVRGRVRILDSPKAIHRMKKDEILVAPMTSPDFIHAMKLSKAIITDVGGLMSHAAVVSRELKKPCVVGTKIATKVFKDGDLVEVDGERGVIKKI